MEEAALLGHQACLALDSYAWLLLMDQSMWSGLGFLEFESEREMKGFWILW